MYFLQYDMADEHTKEPLHNNPEEAADYVKAVNLLLQSFVNDICGFNCYKCLDAWETFLHTLSQLLSKLDSAYFTNMDTEVVLDTIPDKKCAAFLARPEEATDTVSSQSSDDDKPLPDYAAALKTFTTKDASSIPKKPRYSLRPKTDYI